MTSKKNLDNTIMNKEIKKQLKERREQLKTIKDAFNYQKLLLSTERKRKNKKEISEIIKRYQARKKELETHIKENPVTTERKERREKKRIDKLTEQQSHAFENIECEYIKTNSAYDGKSTEWIVRKKGDTKQNIILYDDESEDQIIKSDAAVVLFGMIKCKKRINSARISTFERTISE